MGRSNIKWTAVVTWWVSLSGICQNCQIASLHSDFILLRCLPKFLINAQLFVGAIANMLLLAHKPSDWDVLYGGTSMEMVLTLSVRGVQHWISNQPHHHHPQHASELFLLLSVRRSIGLFIVRIGNITLFLFLFCTDCVIMFQAFAKNWEKLKYWIKRDTE